MKKLLLLGLTLIGAVGAYTQRPIADLLVYHAKMYTVDPNFSVAEAMVIDKGKILAVGNTTTLSSQYQFKESVDAKGKFVYPGFIDAHAHFVGYAQSLSSANLTGTGSWGEILQNLKAFAKENPEGWLVGRGWDQNDWTNKSFPDNQELNALFPDRPVLLIRIDGHAAIANQRAFSLAGIHSAKPITGGEIIVKNGQLTGVLIDNAVDLVDRMVPPLSDAHFRKFLLKAQENCLALGLTTLDDCGLDAATIESLKQMQEHNELKLRIYAMLSDSKRNFEYAEKKGLQIGDRLTVRSFKVYGDGALGSRGACLLQPYSDQPGHRGFLLSNLAHYDSVANWCFRNGWQMNTHAIGDSGNRMLLQTYSKYLAHSKKQDLRWRVEHAQVVNKADLEYFALYGIIPSVQPTHATSDMYWAEDRLGKERLPDAYAYKSLLNKAGWLPLGTDFPVEDISPFKTFCAAVFRQDATDWPKGGFQMKEALSREETLRGMTIWAAKGNFEEELKGSLEKGKWADFIILDTDLMKASASEIRRAKVLSTYINGERLYTQTL